MHYIWASFCIVLLGFLRLAGAQQQQQQQQQQLESNNTREDELILPLLPDPVAHDEEDGDVAVDNDETRFKSEWLEISKNNTNRVFNFGIGSLTSYSSRQHTADPTMPETPSSVPNAIASSVNGIIREFGYCWRYVAASARSCLPEEECIPVVGVFFEVFEEDWVNLRLRENEYAILEVRASIRDKQHQ